MHAGRVAAAVLVTAMLAACSGAGGAADSRSPSATASGGPAPASPSTTASATLPPPQPLPAPVRPGTSRGELLFVQRAEDAALVAGGEPIRLTLARTQNTASWFTSPPARDGGTLTTEEMMLSLGWRPSDTGRTSALPKPFPNGLVSTADTDLPIIIQRANVRSDGTLVLDIRPIGRQVSTVESLGPLTLSIDGAPGVLVLDQDITQDLMARVVVSGRQNQQAFVQLIGYEGTVLESVYLAGDRPSVDYLGDISVGNTQLADIVLDFRAPTTLEPGSVTLSGQLSDHGQTQALTQVIARWSRPAE